MKMPDGERMSLADVSPSERSSVFTILLPSIQYQHLGTYNLDGIPPNLARLPSFSPNSEIVQGYTNLCHLEVQKRNNVAADGLLSRVSIRNPLPAWTG